MHAPPASENCVSCHCIGCAALLVRKLAAYALRRVEAARGGRPVVRALKARALCKGGCPVAGGGGRARGQGARRQGRQGGRATGAAAVYGRGDGILGAPMEHQQHAALQGARRARRADAGAAACGRACNICCRGCVCQSSIEQACGKNEFTCNARPGYLRRRLTSPLVSGRCVWCSERTYSTTHPAQGSVLRYSWAASCPRASRSPGCARSRAAVRVLQPRAPRAGLRAALRHGRRADHGRHGALAVRRLLPQRVLLARGGPRAVLGQLPAPGRAQGAPPPPAPRVG